MAVYNINLEIHTFQIREKRQKETFLSLDNFFEREDILKFFEEFANQHSNLSISEKQQKSLQFTNIKRYTSQSRIISGIVDSGDYGVESRIADQKGILKYTKGSDELDIKPFYYLIWVPSNANIGIIMTQRLGPFGIHGIFTQRFQAFFKNKFPELMVDLAPYLSKGLAKKFIETGGIRQIILRRYSLPSDISDQFGLNFEHTKIKSVELRIVAENNTFFPINDRAKKFLSDENARLFTMEELNSIGFDGNHHELITVKMGRNTRTIDLSATGQIKPFFDIDSDVVKGSDGHPTFDSIDETSRGLLTDIIDEISSRK